MTEKEFDQVNETEQCAFDPDAVYEDMDWENEIRLDKIDEIVARTKLSFSEAKAVLEEHDYDLIEALVAIDEAKKQEKAEKKQKIREKYEDAKDFSHEQYEKIKTGSVDGYNELKEKIKNLDFKEEIHSVYGKAKDVVSTPIKVTKDGKELPAGVIGAGLVTLLYPLHKSKGAAAAGLGAIGAWAVAKQKDNEQLKGMVSDFSRNFSESFGNMSKKEDDCFTIKVDENHHPITFESNTEEDK